MSNGCLTVLRRLRLCDIQKRLQTCHAGKSHHSAAGPAGTARKVPGQFLKTLIFTVSKERRQQLPSRHSVAGSALLQGSATHRQSYSRKILKNNGRPVPLNCHEESRISDKKTSRNHRRRKMHLSPETRTAVLVLSSIIPKHLQKTTLKL